MKYNRAILLLAVTVLIALVSQTFIGCGSEPYTIDEDTGERPKYRPPVDTAKISENKEKDTATTRIKVMPKRKPKKYIVRSYPKFTLQVIAGYNLGIAELTASTENISQVQQFEKGENFGVRRGFGLMVSAKLPFDPGGNLRVTFNSGFNMFTNNRFYSVVSTGGTIKYYVTSLGFGLENSFTPSFRFKPYLSVAALANMIWGKANYTDDNGSNVDLNIKYSFRIGFMAGSGIEYLVNEKLGLNLGISITGANVIFKQSKASSETYKVPLRDKRNEILLTYGGYKQFVYATFYAGVNIYFGITGRKFKI